MKEYLRCMAPECSALLTKTAISQGECSGCGGNRFRPINPKKNPFTPEELEIIANGEVAVIDTEVAGEHPDVANYDNEEYWKRVMEEMPEKYERKRAAAKKVIEAQEGETANG